MLEQQEKQSANIEDLSDRNEEEELKRRQRINWSEEENERLFSTLLIGHNTIGLLSS